VVEGQEKAAPDRDAREQPGGHRHPVAGEGAALKAAVAEKIEADKRLPATRLSRGPWSTRDIAPVDLEERRS
jgi:hypothetical protein